MKHTIREVMLLQVILGSLLAGFGASCSSHDLPLICLTAILVGWAIYGLILATIKNEADKAAYREALD